MSASLVLPEQHRSDSPHCPSGPRAAPEMARFMFAPSLVLPDQHRENVKRLFLSVFGGGRCRTAAPSPRIPTGQEWRGAPENGVVGETAPGSARARARSGLPARACRDAYRRFARRRPARGRHAFPHPPCQPRKFHRLTCAVTLRKPPPTSPVGHTGAFIPTEINFERAPEGSYSDQANNQT